MDFGNTVFIDQNGKCYFADSVNTLKKQLGAENSMDVYTYRGKAKMRVGYLIKGLCLVEYRAHETPYAD